MFVMIAPIYFNKNKAVGESVSNASANENNVALERDSAVLLFR